MYRWKYRTFQWARRPGILLSKCKHSALDSRLLQERLCRCWSRCTDRAFEIITVRLNKLLTWSVLLSLDPFLDSSALSDSVSSYVHLHYYMQNIFCREFNFLRGSWRTNPSQKKINWQAKLVRFLLAQGSMYHGRSTSVTRQLLCKWVPFD